MTPPPHLLRSFDVTTPLPVAQTDRARLWKVTQSDGTFACLKHYNGPKHAADERPGISLLQAWDGQGAVRVIAQQPDAVLLEWLEGPDLGDLVRAGRDEAATDILAQTARCLHGRPICAPNGLHRIETRVRPLLAARFGADCPPNLKHDMTLAIALVQPLLASDAERIPLHGDLHHDNIRRSARGDLAIDPKGVLGPRGYDYANAFRNPLGAEDLFTDPTVVARRAAHWAQTSGLPAPMLLDWAAVQAAMSLVWRHEGHIGAEAAPEGAFIGTLLAVRDQLG